MRPSKSLSLAIALSALVAATASQAESRVLELENPSFEKGTGGYWISLPGAASIDDENSTQGARSLRLDLDGRKVDAVFYIPQRKDEAWTIEFDAKGEGAASLQVKAMLRGGSDGSPICFWTPKDGASCLAEFKPSGKWSRFKCEFGPLPEAKMGKKVANAGIFLTALSSSPAKIWLDNIAVRSTPWTELKPEAEEMKPAGQEPSSQPQSAKTEAKAAAKAKPIVWNRQAMPAPDDWLDKRIKISLPSPVQMYESSVRLSVAGAESAKGASVRMRILDFRDELKFEKTADALAGIETVIEKPGYYGVEVTLEKDGKAYAQRASSLVVMEPLPADYYSTPEPRFGVWGIDDELLRMAGGKWTRKLFFTVFQKPDFKGEPPSAETVAARSPVKVIECLNILNPFKKMVPVPQEDWAAILEKTSKEIKAKKGLVDVWETQNEPMVGENFHGKMEDVVEIIANESRLVRSLDPGRPIAGICVNPMSANQYGQITGYYSRFGMDKLADAVMIHPYIPNSAAPDSSGYPEMLEKLGRDLHGISGHEVPIYISEIGYSTKPGGEVSEFEQAAYMARVALINRGFPNLKACVWHIGLWNEATSQRELDYGIQRKLPKGSPLREPKPAFAAWATMSRQTYNADYIADLEFGRGAKVMLFAKNGEPLLVAYSLSKTPKSLKIPLSGGKASITDLCGSPSEKATEKGVLSLEVDEAPVYIAGGSAEDLARLKDMKVAFSPKELKAKPGQAAELSLKGSPLAVEGATLKIEAPQGWKASASGEGDSWKARIEVPQEAAPGEQSFFIHLVKDGESKRIWRREISVEAPIEIDGLKCSAGGGNETRLSFLAKSEDKDARFKLKIFEDEKEIGSGEFKANEASVLKMPQASFGRPRQYSFEIDDGVRKPWRTPAQAIGLFPVSKGFSKFSLANGEPSKGAVNGAFDVPEGSLELGWSEKALLIRISMKDKWHVAASSPEGMFGGDSLQIAFAVEQSEMIHPNNDGIQETLYTEFGLMPAEGGVCKSWVWASSNRNLSELSAPMPGVEAKWSREGDTTSYVAEIPWRSLNVKEPREGMKLRFSLLVNDADESKQRHWLEWYSGIANGKDPSLFGEGVLTK